jgi:hypothetical protein
MTNTTYNGWTNYATWRVNLEVFDGWSANDLDSLTMGDTRNLHQQLQNYIEDFICETSQGLAKGYALAFLSEVNWHEIAKHFTSEN